MPPTDARFRDEPPREDLPRETERSATARDLLVTFAIVVVLVTIANAVVAFHLERSEIGLIGTKWGMLQQLEQAPDWLVLGDSTCNQGVDPEVWGPSTLNLCTVADATVVDDAWMLASWGERPTPQAILIVHGFDVWPRSFETALLADYPQPWGFWNSGTVAVQPTNKELVDVFMLRNVPLYSRSARLTGLEEVRTSAAGGAEHQRAVTPGVFVRDDGFMPWPYANPQALDADVKSSIEGIGEGFSISEQNRLALTYIAEFAAVRGVPVVIANAPVYEGVAGMSSYQRYEREMYRALNEFAAGHENVLYLDETFHSTREESELVDHVTHAEAKRYTRWLRARVDERFPKRGE